MVRLSVVAAACVLATAVCASALGAGGIKPQKPNAGAQGEDETFVTQVMKDVRPLLEKDKIQDAVQRVDRGIQNADTELQVFQLRMTNIRVLLAASLQGKVDEKMLRQQAQALLDESSGRRGERAYLIAGKVNAALGSYDRATDLLEKYLDRYPEPPATEARDYKRTHGQSHPRLMYRYLARRMLDKVQMVGEQVPDFELATLDGTSRTPESYEGKVWLLNFWATWCEASRKELPNLRRLRLTHRDEFAILGLSMDKTRDKLETFIAKYEISWDQVHLEQGSIVPNRFSVQSLPAMFLIDEEGTVQAVGVRGKRLRKKVKELLND